MLIRVLFALRGVGSVDDLAPGALHDRGFPTRVKIPRSLSSALPVSLNPQWRNGAKEARRANGQRGIGPEWKDSCAVFAICERSRRAARQTRSPLRTDGLVLRNRHLIGPPTWASAWRRRNITFNRRCRRRLRGSDVHARNSLPMYGPDLAPGLTRAPTALGPFLSVKQPSRGSCS